MKVKLFFMAAMALCIAACSNNATPSGENSSVSFRANIAERVSSRASGTAWDAGDNIGITATNFINQKFTTETGNGNFSGADYYFAAATDNFSAYYPFAGTAGTSAGVITKTIASSDQTASGQKAIDFLYATTSATSSEPTVTFQFTHRMSLINLKFVAGTGDVTISDLAYTLGGLKLSGSFNTEDGTATSSGEVGSLSMSGIGANSSLIFFPQSEATANLAVTIGGTTYKTTLNVPALASGKSYSYTITINRTGISVSGAKITDWEVGEVVNPNVNATV